MTPHRCSPDDFAWQKLPPLPAPKAAPAAGRCAARSSARHRRGVRELRARAPGSCSAARSRSPARVSRRAFMSAVLAEAAVASRASRACSLTTRARCRSAATCVPVPPAVADRLRAGAGAHAITANIADEGASRAVRCLVWRPPNSTRTTARVPAVRHGVRPPLRRVRPLHRGRGAARQLEVLRGDHLDGPRRHGDGRRARSCSGCTGRATTRSCGARRRRSHHDRRGAWGSGSRSPRSARSAGASAARSLRCRT